jgi:capsid protein
MVTGLPIFLLRSRRYENIHADPAIAAKTRFFAAASLVTGALALIGPSRFFRELSAMLEVANMSRAQEIRACRMYPDAAVEHNTADFIHYEQTLVQAALDSLRRQHPERYHQEIELANFLLNAMNRTVARRVLRWTFADAVRAVIAELGVNIDFARQSHREMLGLQLARACARSSRF